MSTYILNTIWYEITLIIGLYLQYYFFRNTPLLVDKKWKQVLPYLMYMLWLNINYVVVIPVIFRLAAQVVIFVFFARYVYDIKTREILGKSLLYLCIVSICELLVVQIWDIFDPTPLVIEYADNTLLHYSLQIAIFILEFGIIYLMDKLFLKKRGDRIQYVKEDLFPFLISMITSFSINMCILFNMEFVEDTAYVGIFFVCSLVILFLFIYNSNMYTKRLEKRQKEQEEKRALFEMEMQKNYYEQKLEDEERLKSIYHDFKNHLLILEEHEGDEKSEAIKEIREKVSGYEDYQSTGNKYLDIVLKEKSTQARQEGIEVRVDVTPGVVDFISSLDISSIFGNLFDNAIEACRKIERGERFIELKIRVQNSLLVISMTNSNNGNSGDDLKTSKEDKNMHGFGIKNIVRSLQKYEGYHSITRSGGEFQFHITIPVSK